MCYLVLHPYCLNLYVDGSQAYLLPVLDVIKLGSYIELVCETIIAVTYTMCEIPYETEVPWKKGKQDAVQDFFKVRACYYDVQMDNIYNGPSIAAKVLSSLVPDKKKKVLDIAAGTGLVGKALSLEGFTNLTALDRSEEMLRQSASKNVYSQLICGPFEVKAKEMLQETFHVCICVGAFMTAGFLDPTLNIKEMVRLVEKGGLILLLVNGTELKEPECEATLMGLENACEEITKNGICECLQKCTIPKYLKDCEGIMWIFRKN